MSSKKRVYLVAKEFNISNEALIGFLLKLNYDIRNHMSPISDEAYEEVVKKYGEEAQTAEDDRGFRKMLKDKKAQVEKKKEDARRELEERLKAASLLSEERAKTRKKKKEEAAEEAEKAKKAAAKKKREAKVEAKKEEKERKPKAAKVKKPAHRRIKIVDIPPTPEARRRPRKGEREEGAVTQAPEAVGAEPTPEVAEKKEKIDLDKVMEKARPARKRRGKKADVAEAKPAPAEEAKAKEKARKRRKRRRPQVSQEEIEESIRQTLAAMDETGKPKRRKKKTKAEEIEEEASNILRVPEFISAAELAGMLDVESNELITKCLELGMMVSINQRLDMDTIVVVASEFGFDVEPVEEYGTDFIEEDEEEDDVKDLLERPPVVTIMGHVDHGKTSLLDRIRESNIIAGEVGSITQHIGAYEVAIDGKAITFLDTPGHEAFTAMRARGAQVTDIVVLVVAADDAVMPQTIEAINHAKAASVSIIVAINKIDKPGANADLIKQQLADHGVLVEDWGGKYQSVELSAKTGAGVDKLLEMILLEAEVLELKANPNRLARGVVIESRLDKGKGPIATVLVEKGTLHVGDPFVAGHVSGRVRSMFNERGKKMVNALPSCPAQVLGFTEVPQAGDRLMVLESERVSREISQRRQQLRREQEAHRMRHMTLDQISKEIREGKVKQLRVIIKADVDGSVEALSDAMMKLGTKEVAVNVVHKGVGAISEPDVLLASASDAVIIGFSIRPTIDARELAAREDIDIRLYDIIYDATDDIKAALEGMLEPEISEQLSGTAEVRQIFKIPKVGMIAGCHVLTGRVSRNDNAKLYREDKLIHEGKLSSLKRFKDDVKEVAAGFECGIGLEGYDDIKVSDVIETYEIIKTERKL